MEEEEPRESQEEEESQELEIDETMFTHCYVCKEELPPRDSETIKKLRRMKCNTCLRLARKGAIRSEPVRFLYQKLYYWNYRNHIIPKSFLNKKTVQEVYDRCGGKCVLTGEEDFNFLSIVCVRDVVENLDDLTLVANTEANKLRKIKSPERELYFKSKKNSL